MLKANTEKPSDYSKGVSKVNLEKQLERFELLNKLNEKAKGLVLIKELVVMYPNEPEVLKSAIYMLLDAGEKQAAKDLLVRLKALNLLDEDILETEAYLLAEEGHVQEALQVIEELTLKGPLKEDLRSLKASLWVQTGQRPEARKLYAQLYEESVRQKGSSATKRQEYLKEWYFLRDQYGNRLETGFEYFHGPSHDREYEIDQVIRFQLSDAWQNKIIIKEAILKKGGQAETGSIDRILIGHRWEQAWLSQPLNLRGAWESTYYGDSAVQSLEGSVEWIKPNWELKSGYIWNQLLQDPVESLAKEGVQDTLWDRSSVKFLKRIELYQEGKLAWYRLDQDKDLVFGAEHLGHKWDQTVGTNLTLTNQPYFSVGYFYRETHWNRKFKQADQVIGILGDEQVHAFQAYLEWQRSPYDKYFGSVVRSSDRKRHVDSVLWSTGAALNFLDRFQLEGRYEYIVGDSGTSGAGNSQTFSLRGIWYFE